MRLFESGRLTQTFIKDATLQIIFKSECELVSSCGWTPLMSLCRFAPTLLGSVWACELLQLHMGKRDTRGRTALLELLHSNGAEEANLQHEQFGILYNAEKNMLDNTGRTITDVLKSLPSLAELIYKPVVITDQL